MAMIRCPQCNAPLTDGETATGTCPICAAPVHSPAPVAVHAPSLPQVTAPTLALTLLFLVCGAVAFCLLPFGVIFYASLPDEKKKEPTEAGRKEPTAQLAKVEPNKTAGPDLAKKGPEDKKQPEAKQEEAKTFETPKKDEVKKEEPKKVEVKIEEPKKVEVKIEEPKKVEVKKVEPMKEEPPPARVALANAYLPLLADDAIKMDGDLADWKDIRPQLLNAVARGNPTKKLGALPKTQKAYLAYCSKGILVAVDVVDTSGELENVGKPARGMWPFWDNDAVEVYIDTLNRRPRQRGEANAHQFFAFPLGTPTDAGIGGYESRILGSAWTIVPYPNTGKNAMPRAGRKTPDGWTLEMLIPKAALRHGDMKPGQIVGFEVQIDTGTNVYYFWSNDNPDVRVSTNPSSWGEIGFAGTDAKLEIVGKDGLPIASFLPGEPLRIRLTDADANLDPAVKEKIHVTLITKGDRQTLVLEESKANAGVFFGVMPTRLSIRRPEPGLFDVLAGETVVVEYLDQVRANGARNVIERAKIESKGR